MLYSTYVYVLCLFHSMIGLRQQWYTRSIYEYLGYFQFYCYQQCLKGASYVYLLEQNSTFLGEIPRVALLSHRVWIFKNFTDTAKLSPYIAVSVSPLKRRKILLFSDHKMFTMGRNKWLKNYFSLHICILRRRSEKRRHWWRMTIYWRKC